MNPIRWIFTYGCKLGMSFVLKVDARELAKVPRDGPMIVFINHQGLSEGPIFYTHLAPRPKVTALGKIELFKVPVLGMIMRIWRVIPVRRGEADREAVRECIERLKDGWILGIAPEGRRSPDGSLLPAHAGVAFLALQSGAPVLPVAHWGALDMKSYLRRFRRTPITMRAGRAFRLDSKGQKLTKEIRQEMADEMMYQLSALLPEKYRGAYSDLSKSTTKWLSFFDEAAAE